jgi:hypothetical protein
MVYLPIGMRKFAKKMFRGFSSEIDLHDFTEYIPTVPRRLFYQSIGKSTLVWPTSGSTILFLSTLVSMPCDFYD